MNTLRKKYYYDLTFNPCSLTFIIVCWYSILCVSNIFFLYFRGSNEVLSNVIFQWNSLLFMSFFWKRGHMTFVFPSCKVPFSKYSLIIVFTLYFFICSNLKTSSDTRSRFFKELIHTSKFVQCFNKKGSFFAFIFKSIKCLYILHSKRSALKWFL